MPLNTNPAGWGPMPGPAAAASADGNASWSFPSAGVVPGDITQQHIFPSDDLTRPY
uniref:Secreted protein n=1 Tax=Syphacia muris TaxID=451379 RepID=A0A0N5AB33_9BILA